MRSRAVSRRLRIAASLGALSMLAAAVATGPAATAAQAGAWPATIAPASTPSPAGTPSPASAAGTPALWPTLAPFHRLVVANVE
ncbi:MAG TPA: hypothetical protein VKV33_01165, partial [Streptosporangiaceae bacterium]|nr:hypothetical protein [Streptosporangiaceae bacterium]